MICRLVFGFSLHELEDIPLVNCNMPDNTGGRESQTRPEMPKRSMPSSQILQQQLVKQKRTRDSGLRSARPENSVKNLHKVQKPAHRLHSDNRNGASSSHQGQNLRKQNGPSSLRSNPADLEGKADFGSSDGEQSSTTERSDGCVTDEVPPEVTFTDNDASHDDDHASSPHQGARIDTLEAECAALCISSANCSSEASLGTSSAGKELPEASQVVEVSSLPAELIHDVLGRVDMRFAMRLRGKLGRAFRDSIHHPAFLRSRPSAEGEFSPSFFTTDTTGDLHWQGFDTKLRKWATLPSLNFAKNRLPSPDPDLFKDYLVAGDGGLLCINVGKSTGCEELVVCNPLTQQVKVLPPLKYPRHPVLMHLRVDPTTGNYKVLVAGSAAIGTEDLSLKTEEYDSTAGTWECPEGSDLPCPPFGLNEYQNGVYFTDSDRELLLCVAIVDTRGRGVLVYDLKKKKWLQGGMQGGTQFHIPLVRSEPHEGYLATTQIVKCRGDVFVFSEQECGREVYFLIHRLNLEIHDSQDGIMHNNPWDEVLRRKRAGGRGLLVYPEFTCVPVSEHELCIFSTVEHTIEIVDLNKPTEVAPLLPAPSFPKANYNRFHSLNPIGFVFKPSFKSVVCPRGRNPEFRCDLKGREYCSECERKELGFGPDDVKDVDPKMMGGSHPPSVEVVAESTVRLICLDKSPGGSSDMRTHKQGVCGMADMEKKRAERGNVGQARLLLNVT